MNLFQRAMRRLGYAPIHASVAPFVGASRGRLDYDWAVRILSADQENRTSLRNMRARCRQLANNNDYAVRFLNKVKENVIGANGIGLQMQFDEELVPQATKLNEAIESAWLRFCDKVTADGRSNIVDFLQLGVQSQMQDGECFYRKVKGYPFNANRFAVELLDPDMIDVMWNRLRRPGNEGDQENEVRMGVEVDRWRRPVAYWAFEGHPAEFAGVKRVRIDAEEMEHVFVPMRIGQTRGVPWMHAAMSSMHHLDGYKIAELVAARFEACKVGYFKVDAPEDYQPGVREKDGKGAITPADEPGQWETLPPGVEPVPVNWNHPNSAFGEFMSAQLHAIAAGLNVSYSSLTGDLREVNFSSLRQGVLDEREGWRILQAFARDHLVRPVFAQWLPMAVTTGQLELPPRLPLEMVIEAAQWSPRGWDWVDPLKDSQADVMDIRSGRGTLADSCSRRGKDWRDVLLQRKKENDYAQKLGVPLDFTTTGSGGVEGDTASENAPGGSSSKTARPPKPNGQGMLVGVRGVQ